MALYAASGMSTSRKLQWIQQEPRPLFPSFKRRKKKKFYYSNPYARLFYFPLPPSLPPLFVTFLILLFEVSAVIQVVAVCLSATNLPLGLREPQYSIETEWRDSGVPVRRRPSARERPVLWAGDGRPASQQDFLFSPSAPSLSS